MQSKSRCNTFFTFKIVKFLLRMLYVYSFRALFECLTSHFYSYVFPINAAFAMLCVLSLVTNAELAVLCCLLLLPPPPHSLDVIRVSTQNEHI